MKKLFKAFVSFALLGLVLAGISCANVAGLPTGNVQAGSSSDPFKNSNWSVAANYPAGKILYFYDGNKVSYGSNYGNGSGFEWKGNYSVTKQDGKYTANCLISVNGEKMLIKLEINSANSTTGNLLIASNYNTLYRL